MLLEKVFSTTGAEKITLLASRKDTKATVTEQFKASLDAAFGESITVVTKRPNEEKSLQIADCVSWGLFRQYESNDPTYFQEIEPILYEFNY